MDRMKTGTKEENRAQDQAKSQLESIIEVVDWLEHAQNCTDADCKQGASGGDYWDDRDEYHDQERPQQIISEDPLSIGVRSDWHTPGDNGVSTDFTILLCTGGPAVRIIGKLNDRFHEPESARIEFQDWGTRWEDMPLTEEQEEKILTYCRQFYFGN
jgi:hypothetical protein